jgi:hypothetical protein
VLFRGHRKVCSIRRAQELERHRQTRLEIPSPLGVYSARRMREPLV